MAVIWKYLVKPGRFTLDVPLGAVPLAVQVQGGEPVLWLQVEPSRPMMPMAFRTISTGSQFEAAEVLYVGTFQLEGGALVFHLFVDFTPPGPDSLTGTRT